MTWLSSGLRTQTLLVPGSNILEIEIEPDLIPPTPPTPAVAMKPNQDFVDPAILSYSKKDALSSHNIQSGVDENSRILASQEGVAASVQSPFKSPKEPHISPTPIPVKISEEGRSPIRPVSPVHASASATLSGPFNELSLNGIEEPVSGVSALEREPIKWKQSSDLKTVTEAQLQSSNSKAVTETPASKGRGKRAGKNTRRKETLVSTPTQTPTDLEFAASSLSTQRRRGHNRRGWRQTPILEELPVADVRPSRAQNSLTSPDLVLKPGTAARNGRPTPEPTKAKRRRYREEDDQTGWATGEATDIQDMGDFDFEENHKKFDKRKVFEEIRKDDTTADESRLVSFNRLKSARPGTAGGKNLHYTENVLDGPKSNVGHSSGDSEIDISENRISSGRSMSRASTRRTAPSRKGSALVNMSLDGVGSPKLKTDSSTSQRKASIASSKPSFQLGYTNRACPVISPLQMIELEQLATSELAMTEDILTENAARGIAQSAITLTLTDDADRNASLLMAILAGNNKTGSRAIAAARHLRNHNVRIVLCVLGLEREVDLIDSVRRQLKIFRSCGGQAINQDSLMRTLRKINSPVDLILDALLGIHVSFDDLRTDDQAAYFQLVCWANGNDADILCLDVPSGIDASTGAETFHDSTSLVIRSRHVISLGAPKTGLLTYLTEMESSKRRDFNLAIADIGIGPVAWRKFGTRRRNGVDFGGVWVSSLEFRDGVQT